MLKSAIGCTEGLLLFGFNCTWCLYALVKERYCPCCPEILVELRAQGEGGKLSLVGHCLKMLQQKGWSLIGTLMKKKTASFWNEPRIIHCILRSCLTALNVSFSSCVTIMHSSYQARETSLKSKHKNKKDWFLPPRYRPPHSHFSLP